MLAPDRIAELIVASPAEFNRVFLQSQVEAGLDLARRASFAAVVLDRDEKSALRHALQHALLGGWLPIVVQLLLEENLHDGRLVEALAEQSDSAPLQAIVEFARGMAHPQMFCRGIASCARWTVKVVVDGEAKGTGVLIGPHLVLTAWHVVMSLFDRQQPGGPYVPRPEGQRIAVVFDEMIFVAGSQRQSTRSRTVRARQDWCFAFSACHDAEMSGSLPAALAELEDCWDYAVLQLESAPGRERHWVVPDDRAIVPRADARIWVFQHPDGQSMRFDQGSIVRHSASEAAAVPRLRFLHGANAVGGSSGGPCFDQSFLLFGLHQGCWRKDAVQTINRGVPLAQVLEHVRREKGAFPVPQASESAVWKLGPEDRAAAVIGCDAFQRLVWQSVLIGTPRIIRIDGAQYSGKTFLLSVLSAMLPGSGHLKIELEAATLAGLHATALALRICAIAGAVAPDFKTLAACATSAATWVRDELAGKTAEALQHAAGKRAVWLLLRDLNKGSLDGAYAEDYLLCLYELVADLPWLWLVVDSMRGDLPHHLRHVVVPHWAEVPDETAVAVYLRRALTELGFVIDDDKIDFAATFVMKAFLRARAATPESALRILQKEVVEAVETCIKVEEQKYARRS